MLATSQRRTIDLPSGSISYRESGPEDGQAVVFVHGFLVDDALWSDVPERVAAHGLRTLAPTLPLGAHTTQIHADADLSPRGQARIVLSFLEALNLHEVVLVGNDTGGGICQIVLDEDPERIGRLVLTNCDAFEVFPPFPFGLLVSLCRRPILGRLLFQVMRPAALRNSILGFGGLVRRDLGAEESRAWVQPYLDRADVRRDVAKLARGWDRKALVDVSARLASFDGPALLCWAPADPFFKIELGRRLAATIPDSRLIEVADARTFVSLDQPGRLADEIAAFVKA